MNTFQFKLITPAREVVSEAVTSVTANTELGQITVLPHHSPLVTTIVPGELTVHVGQQVKHLAVAGGFLEVRSGGEVAVLADSAEHSYEIDTERAAAAEARAKALIKEEQLSDEEYARLRASIERSIARQLVFKRRSGSQPNSLGDTTNR